MWLPHLRIVEVRSPILGVGCDVDDFVWQKADGLVEDGWIKVKR